MKIIGTLLVMLCVLVSSTVIAKDKTMSARIAKPGNPPCTCVFNKKRAWNPEKVLWNDAYWKCSIYKDDGTCAEVKEIKDVEVTEDESKGADKEEGDY